VALLSGSLVSQVIYMPERSHLSYIIEFGHGSLLLVSSFSVPSLSLHSSHHFPPQRCSHHVKVALILVVGGSLVIFSGTAFINILMATIGMLLASISFSFLVYTFVNRSQFGNIVALVWLMVSINLYATLEESLTPNGMAGFGWNFVMACFRAYQLMETGVSAFAPGYNLSVAITWLYIDTGIYLFLAWYAAELA
jgi:hypothetical protein